MKSLKKVLLIALIGMVAAGASAARIGTAVTGNITVDTTWNKAGSPYYLVGDVYVLSPASLTVEAGVVVASYVDNLGSLAICQGAQIHVMGTQTEPVIFTSAEDVATWTGTTGVVRAGSVIPGGFGVNVNAVSEINGTMGDPKTGTLRTACNEWGTICVMGNGYLSGSHYGFAASTWIAADGTTINTNTKCPNAMNKKYMEGLVKVGAGDQRQLYGGSNDNDDSGEIHYISLRYGGRNVDVNKELNGLSLGAIGRNTDIDHVEIMSNLDDGIEIWGGTVQLDHVSIWNAGDDSIDLDEGWRGSLDCALIVQGESRVAKSGSGTSDNAFEMDGAEDADAQPMGTVKISHVTVVGQPATPVIVGPTTYNKGCGDGTEWRDNMRAQFDKSIWCDGSLNGVEGDKASGIIYFNNSDTDGGLGYDGTCTSADKDGAKNRVGSTLGTLGWVGHWITSYSNWKIGPSADPRGCGINYAALYENYMTIDPTKPLCDITNSVIHNYTTTEYGLLVADGADLSGNTFPAALPIQKVTRGPAVTYSVSGTNYVIYPVTKLNPLPKAGVTAGAFKANNWLIGWTAADSYGLIERVVTTDGADLNGDGEVDLSDLSSFSAQWLL